MGECSSLEEDAYRKRSETTTHGLTIVPEDSDVSLVRHTTLIWGGDRETWLVTGVSGPSLFVVLSKDTVNFRYCCTLVTCTCSPHIGRVWILPQCCKHDSKSWSLHTHHRADITSLTHVRNGQKERPREGGAIALKPSFQYKRALVV